MLKLRTPAILVCFLLLCVPAFSEPLPVEKPDSVQIWRDYRGVPHVIAGSTTGVYWGFGYCTGKDRMLQIELLRRSVQGRLAELFGESFLDADLLARRDAVSIEELKSELESCSPQFREILTAFTAGLNRAIFDALQGKSPINPAFESLKIEPSVFSEAEVLELFAGTMAVRYNDFTLELDNLDFLSKLVRKFGAKKTSQIFEDVVFYRDPLVTSTLGASLSAPLELRSAPRVPSHQYFPPGNSPPTLRKQKRNQQLKSIGIPEKSGSYAAVISNRKYGIAEAFLFGGPQMGYFKPSAVYEIGLHTPKFDIVGTTCAGYFVLLFAANRNIAFTATAGVANQIDIITMHARNEDAKFLSGANLTLEKTGRTEAFVVKDKKIKVEKTIESTPIGPVVNEKNGIHFIKKRAWQGRVVASYDAWVRSNFAGSLDEWLTTSDGMALSIHWLGADKLGHIAYSYCGLGKSRRSFGDDRLPSDRVTDLPYPDIRVMGKDPDSGYYTNWNCPPYDTFRNGDMQTAWGRDQRTRFINDYLEHSGDFWSAQTMKNLDQQIAFTDLRAHFFKNFLVEFIDDAKITPHAQAALKILSDWNNTRTDHDSDKLIDNPGAGLFESFWNRLFQALFAEPLGEHIWLISSDPTWTQSSIVYSALKGQTEFDYLGGKDPTDLVTEVFQDTVNSLASEGSPLPRAPCPPMEFPGVNYAGAPTQTAAESFSPFMNRGSDVQIISLSPGGITIQGVMPPGNAEVGPHSKDQMKDFQMFRYRSRALTANGVKWSSRLTEVLTPK